MILRLLFIFFTGFLFAQMPSKTWQFQNANTTDTLGIALQDAKDFLKEKKRKPHAIVVAVLDGGVDVQHEDLKNNLWINQKEKPNNGKDDDENGYVDDIYGWNFLGNKDGENVNYETLEITRLYKKYSDLLEYNPGEVPDFVQKAYPTEYAEYKKYREYFLDAQKEAEDNYMRAEKNKNEMIAVLKKMHSYVGDDILTVHHLQKLGNIENEWSKDELVKLKSYVSKIPEDEKLTVVEHVEKIQDEFEHSYAYLQKHYFYNLDFDGRSIVGDDPTFLKEKGYGNADVAGPDADHGTHVAGLIGAENGNTFGAKGVGGDEVQIMAVRMVPNGDEHDKDVANAIKYAVDNGARIINMSFGKEFSPNKGLVWDAMKYAEDNGVLIVKAAGNNGTNVDFNVHYPSVMNEEINIKVKNVINVGASTPNKKAPAAYFSNYGPETVDVFAPGYYVYSTIPNNEYAQYPGTSMASPVVAGVAALVWSYYPDITMGQLKQILVKSVNQVEGLDKKCVSGGVIDALKAVKMAEELTKKK